MKYSFFKKGMAALAAIACTCGVSVAGAASVGSLVASDNYNLYWGGSYANVTNTGSGYTTGYNTALGKGTSAGMSVEKNWSGEYTTTTSQTYSYGMAWGSESRAANNLATAFGLKSVATGVKATAFGEKTLASGETATAFGHLTTASGDRATAFGYKTTASGIASTAFGAENTASGQSSVAFGQKTTASGEAATAFGQDTVASGRSAVAMGEHSEAIATNSLAALGGTTTAEATGSAAIGSGAVAALEGTVALGSGSLADRQAGQAGYLKTDERTGAAWTATANAISIGNVNAVDDDGNTAPVTRQIIGVAAGSQATDAVNVAQLEAATKGLVTETKLKVTDDKVTALDTQVGTLNTQVGTLNTQVGVLNTVAGELTGHVGVLDARVTNLDTRVDSVDTQLDTLNTRVDGVNTRVNQLDNRINKVGAHAAALAALHPLDYDPSYRWDFAAGVGNYKDANAMAVGAFYRPNGVTMFSVGTTFGGSGSMVNAGISLKVGPGVSNGTTRSNLLDTVQNLKAENEALKERDNAQDSIIAQLRQELDALKDSLNK